MKSKTQLWAVLLDANDNLNAYTQNLDAIPVRSIALEREVSINAAFFAGHLERTLLRLNVAQRAAWIPALMTGDQGYVNEAYAYGILAERNFIFTPVASMPSANLYRASVGTTDLDGSFHHHGIYFDIKSLSRPSGILENLLDEVNARINPNNKFARANGSLDFYQQELNGTAFQAAVEAIVNASTHQNSYSHPGLGVTFRFHDVAAGIQWTEGTFSPYRFARENRHIVITNAKQVPRNECFMFIYVYSELDHELAVFPDFSSIGERALARRVFCDLTRDHALAARYCAKTDPTATVGEVARSIGGLAFVRICQRNSTSDIRFYLNPNANAGQHLTANQVEQMADFGQGVIVDDFHFDNY